MSMEKGEFLGYFTIALKPLTVRDEMVSNTVKRKIKRVSEFDKFLYDVSIPDCTAWQKLHRWQE